MRITLEPWEYRRACDVGIGRVAENWGKADAQHYDRSRMEDDRTAAVAAAKCELAVAKMLNRYWPISRLNGLQGSPLCQGKTSPPQAPLRGGAGSVLNAV